MASILDKYGIKEVADVTFYKINDDGSAGAPVLYLDSLKVSTLEQTAETVYAQGGKGNPRLIGWDFGKEITLSLEDALFSPKSMAIMFGDGSVNVYNGTIKKTVVTRGILKTTTENSKLYWTDSNGTKFELAENGKITYYTDDSKEVIAPTPEQNVDVKLFATFDVKVSGQEIFVGPNTFPDSYYITGDTYARSEVTGEDDYFQFIIPKGKITSENTITMEAEGDPSVFNLNVDVLRATEADGRQVMMKLVKYGTDVVSE